MLRNYKTDKHDFKNKNPKFGFNDFNVKNH